MLRIGSLSCVAAALALIGMTGLAPQARAIEFSTYTLFEGDSLDPNPAALRQLADAIRKAQAPGSCSLGKLQIRTPAGDPIFQDAVSLARRDNVLHALDGMGVPVAGRLFVESTVFGTVGGTDTAYQTALDEKPPRLTTTSVPDKGTKVKPGDQIKITMVARDDPEPWPTGLKTIQLVADSDGGRFVASENYEPCTDPQQRRVEATYVVPANPPLIVRLTALAEDHVGLMDTDVGEFPTQGEWYGTLKYSIDGVTSGVTLTIKDVMDIVLESDGQGNLTGSLVGNRSFSSQGDPTYCNWATTIPNKLSGKLLGSYTPGAEVMSIHLVEPVVAPAPRKDCPGGGYIYSGDSVHEAPQFKSVLQSPRAAGDGRFQSDITWMTTGGYTNSISLRLQRAQN